jgi:hypothetical protein
MKRALISFGLLFFALTLCGLSSRYTIKAVREGGGLVLFQFERSDPSKANGVEVNTFLVVERDDSGQWDYKHPMWALDLSPGSAKLLYTITYGQVPAGFTEAAKPRALIHGVHYLAVGLSPGSGGAIEFVAQ